MNSEPLVCIPFFPGDQLQVKALSDYMRKLSGGKRIGAKLLLCGTHKVDMTGTDKWFEGLFDEIKTGKQIVAPNILPNQQPWPMAPNFQFANLCKTIYQHRTDVDAFYYMEPDSLPLTRDWWGRICEDYEKAGKPYWGMQLPNIERDTRGNNPRVDGVHMVGTGIYPQDAWARLQSVLQPILNDQPGRPWDVLDKDLVNPHCHFTDIAVTVNQVHGFRDVGIEEYSAVHPLSLDPQFKRRNFKLADSCALLHGCKDASVRLWYEKTFGLEPTTELTFAHSGDLGDIIYALPTMKWYSEQGYKIILKLNPNPHGARAPLNPERMALIGPLLEVQPYIERIEYHNGEWVDFDFRQYRHIHRKGTNLVDDQADWCGAPAGLGNQGPWLAPVAKKRSAKYVINRTPRYNNPEFPWEKLLNLISHDAEFIGLNTEFKALLEANPSVRGLVHNDSEDLLDVAQRIAGSDKFIGNQSVCFAIAEAMKHPRIQETSTEDPDCIFESDNGIYCGDGKLDWEQFRKQTESGAAGSPGTFTPSGLDIGHFNLDELLKNPKFIAAVKSIIDDTFSK